MALFLGYYHPHFGTFSCVFFLGVSHPGKVAALLCSHLVWFGLLWSAVV